MRFSLRKIKLLTNNPRKVAGIEVGIEITETVPIELLQVNIIENI